MNTFDTVAYALYDIRQKPYQALFIPHRERLEQTNTIPQSPMYTFQRTQLASFLAVIMAAIVMIVAIKNTESMPTYSYQDDKFITAKFVDSDKFAGEGGPFQSESAPFKAGDSDLLCVKYSWPRKPGDSVRFHNTAITIADDLKPGDAIQVLYLETSNSVGNKLRVPIVARKLTVATVPKNLKH